MFIRAKDFRFCLDKAIEVSDLYKINAIGGSASQKSIDQLHGICVQYMEKTINIYELNEAQPESSILGFYICKPDCYDVIIHPGQNLCWRRFVTCKELFHVILDEEEYRNIEIFQHLEEVAVNFPILESHPGQAAISEVMAEISAMEFLFPFEDRRAIRANAASLDYLAIAHQYKIPQVHVERYLADDFMNGFQPFMPATRIAPSN